MAWILYFLVWMTALTMSLSYNTPVPQFWGWGRQYSIDRTWEVAASSYKFPLTSQRLRIAPLPEVISEENVRSSQDFRAYRVNERSIANSNIQNVPIEGRIQDHRSIEPIQRRSENGSSKILNNFLKPVRRRGQIDSNPITFPGPTDRTVSSRSGFEPEIPESCRNSSFCEDVPNYPQEEVDQLISELGNSLQFHLDKLYVPDTPDINQRLGPVDENVELCQFDEKVIYPRTALGSDGKWLSLLNRRDNPVQGYRVEVCNFSAGTGCANIAVFQQGYEASCRQKYVFRKATAFDKTSDGLKTYETEIKLPSCLELLRRYYCSRHNMTSGSSEADKYSIAYVTVPTIEDGKTIARLLVKNKVAACVNIIPQVTSIYEWKGEMTEDSELLMMIKTKTSEVDRLTELVRSNHPYEVCEVISVPIKNGNLPYLAWIGQQVTNT
ncbi:unnamed protein product [Arctia plantaginis]|uniref:Spaetzle domain-containing protein n=1 Tax=Arctia plantaginis TaxID=874455 RepID=A0A8S1A3W8_ARCPL|nr:unnamed protein product [Arctia plantaginis]